MTKPHAMTTPPMTDEAIEELWWKHRSPKPFARAVLAAQSGLTTPASGQLRKVREVLHRHDYPNSAYVVSAIEAILAEPEAEPPVATPVADDARDALVNLLDSLENNCGRHPVWEKEVEAARKVLADKEIP